MEGDDSNCRSEEGCEVVSFDGRLYVRMEADNTYGAWLWRMKAGIHVPIGRADWGESSPPAPLTGA